MSGPSLLDDPIDRAFLSSDDVEAKIARALDDVARVGGSDVAAVHPRTGLLLGGLAALGARVTAVSPPGDGPDAATTAGLAVITGTADALGLPDASMDVVAGAWNAYRGVDPAEIAEADRVLRPGGRHVAIHDYGRDDLATLMPDRPELTSWSRVGGPFLRAGFKIRVVHCWISFESLESAGGALERAFGERGVALARELRRPRLSYNVAIYHRVRPAT